MDLTKEANQMKEKGGNKNAVNPTFKGAKGDVRLIAIFITSFFERIQIKVFQIGILVGVFLFVSVFISCKGDDIDVPDIPLGGKIGSADWEYKFGNAYLFSSELKYKFILLSTLESGEDSCPIISSSNSHLQMILPFATGSYSLPLTKFDENVKFVLGDGTELRATSGFIEVIAINPDTQQLVGYIQADFDEDNAVLGRFIVELC